MRIDPFGGIDFRNVVATQPSSSPAARPTLDLFPPLLFGDDLLSFRPGGSDEHRNGFALPYDADWRVQAAQVSAMIVGFSALAALCSGGGCMLPNSWLPDQLEADPFFTPDPLPVNVAAGRDLGR